jgi:hypothetical protein
MGRPPVMNAINITVAQPSEEDDLRSPRFWKPYIETSNQLTDSNILPSYVDPVGMSSKHTVSFK